MEKAQPYTHPIVLYNQRIKEEGIVVFDDVRGLPASREPFVSPDYVICIGHRGRIDIMYDDYADFSEQHTVGVIFPNHRLRKVSVTDDYLATLIIVDSSVLGDPLLQIIKQMRYRYEPHPNVKLDKHEYNQNSSLRSPYSVCLQGCESCLDAAFDTVGKRQACCLWSHRQ